MIVHLNGWPGVGKKTIGRLLADRLGARFIHNHLLHDVAIVCAGLGSQDRWPLYDEVRLAAYRALARRPASETFVMTNGLCMDTPREEEAWRHVVELAMVRGAPLVPVVLEAEVHELARRVQSAERLGSKLADPAALRAMVQSASVQRPAVAELIVLDVTHLTAAQAADAIATRLPPRSTLDIASERHLAMR